MKASFMLPSATYNLVLSKDELKKLVDTGYILIQPSREPCTTGRAVWRHELGKMETLDRKSVYNNLRFNLDKPVADIEGGDLPVQFLNIIVED